MQTEIEAKFLGVDTEELRGKMCNLGAKLVHPERLMRRKNFDFPDRRLEKVGAWIRVRDEGDKVTLSYKRLIDRTIAGTKDITVTVADFDATSAILKALGLENKANQETRREKWLIGECEVDIDTWPWIPTLAEIEGPGESAIRSLADKLGFDWSKAVYGSVEIAYQKYFDVTEKEVYDWTRIEFGPAPDWLEARRKVI